jgi:hypothetical protein
MELGEDWWPVGSVKVGSRGMFIYPGTRWNDLLRKLGVFEEVTVTLIIRNTLYVHFAQKLS